LPIENSVRVESVSRKGDGYRVNTNARTSDAAHVVVVMANFQRLRVPAFANELRADVAQLHSFDYTNPPRFARETCSSWERETPAPRSRWSFRARESERVARVESVRDGRPVLADSRMLDVTNVAWCTGFERTFDFVDLPIFESTGEPHEAGVVTTEPGFYFVGLHFLYAMSSTMVHGVGRDAERIASVIAARARRTPSVRVAARS
jgi:hypothetical protein